MTYAPRHLAAAGLFGFVIGAFVVASLGSVPGLRARAPLAAITTPAGGIDGPTNAVVETPVPTSGHDGVIPTSAPESKDLARTQVNPRTRQKRLPSRRFTVAPARSFDFGEYACAQDSAAHRLQPRLAADAAAALLAGLLVIRHALDVLGQTFLLAQLLKPPDHLFGGLVAARFHPDHSNRPFKFPMRLSTSIVGANLVFALCWSRE